MLQRRAFLAIPLILCLLSLVSFVATPIPDSPGCKCRGLVRLGGGGVQFACSTDNCNATQACVPVIIGGTKWCMCNAGGPASTFDAHCFCKSGIVVATGAPVCESLDNCQYPPLDGTGTCFHTLPSGTTWRDLCNCYITPLPPF